MKKIIRFSALLLAVLQLIFILPSCQKNADSNETEALTSSVTETPSAPSAKLMENGKLKYSVIKYDAEQDEANFLAVKKLRDKIKEYTGSTPEMKPHYNTSANSPNSESYEILVGETNYSESKQAFEGLNYGDYRITVVGNKIVIAAYSSADISRAVNYIVGFMLKETDENGNKKLEIYEYAYLAKRNLNSVSINGVDLKEFSIAYATKGQDDDYNLANARVLRQAFSEKAGYLLPIIKDTDDCATSKRIYVGASFNGAAASVVSNPLEPLHYITKTINGDFYIMGGGLLSNQLIVTDFIKDNLNKSPAENKVDITDSEGSYLKVKEAPKAQNSDFRVMTYNITAQWEGWGGDYMPIAQRYEGFASVMQIYDPDIVGLQEVSSQWSEKIPSELGGTYEFVNRNTPDGKFVNLSTIIYKKERFSLIDSGLEYLTPQGPNHIRLVDWAVLKDKQTGKYIAFFNTHWDPSYPTHHTDNIEIVNKVVAAHSQVKYVFSTGDYNTKPGSDPYNAFLANTGLVNSQEVARAAGTLKNDVGGCAKIGVNKEETETTGPIDHIFISQNIDVLAYETVIWNCVHHVSDHSPKYADIVLKD